MWPSTDVHPLTSSLRLHVAGYRTATSLCTGRSRHSSNHVGYERLCACVGRGVRNARPQHLPSRNFRYRNRCLEHGVHRHRSRGRSRGLHGTAPCRIDCRRLHPHHRCRRLRVRPMAYVRSVDAPPRILVPASVICLHCSCGLRVDDSCSGGQWNHAGHAQLVEGS